MNEPVDLFKGMTFADVERWATGLPVRPMQATTILTSTELTEIVNQAKVLCAMVEAKIKQPTALERFGIHMLLMAVRADRQHATDA